MMYLRTHASDVWVADGILMSTEYRPGDVGPGRLQLHRNDAITYDSQEVSLRLDPWFSNKYALEHWVEGAAFVICGATRILVLSEASLETMAAIPIEYEEYDTLESPWMIRGKDVLLISSPTRVFCLDRRLAFRWCWSVDVPSPAWKALFCPPAVEEELVRLSLRSPTRDTEVRISIADATEAGA